MTTVFSGMPAAPGIGLGKAYVHRSKDLTLDVVVSLTQKATHTASNAPHDADQEWAHFQDAQAEVEEELDQLGRTLNKIAADIFAVHQLILHDKTLTDSIFAAIYHKKQSAVEATQSTISEMVAIFRDMEDEYFASRSADIVDIGQRLLTHLGIDLDEVPLSHAPVGSILIANDLTPSDIAQLTRARVAGIALAESTPTAHSSILASSLGLPLVCGLGIDILLLDTGQEVVLDGDIGRLVVQPNSQQVSRYQDAFERLIEQRQDALVHVHEESITRDGIHVPVYINANHPDEIVQGRIAGAEGVGLLRTEYLFQSRIAPPSREEQQLIFQRMADELDGCLMTVRALDAGGDKPVDFLPKADEENPFLGRRGIRLLLKFPELLAEQYRALVEVAVNSTSAKIRYMLPMVSTLDEILTAKRIISEVHSQMDISLGDRAPSRSRVEIGVLIEVPSAALMASQLASTVDFFSIGTNDLAQYVMASDRTNSSVANLADSLHPAVLQLIGHVCKAGENAGLPVSLCGELAGNPHAVPLLLGLGVTELSVSPPNLPLVKQVIRQCEMQRCHQLALAAKRCPNVEEVHELLTAF